MGCGHFLTEYVYTEALADTITIQLQDNSSDPESENLENSDTTEVTKIELVIEKVGVFSSEEYPAEISWNTTGLVSLKLGRLLTQNTRVYGYFLVYFGGISVGHIFPRPRNMEKKIEFIVM